LCDAARLQPTAGRSVNGRTLYLRDVRMEARADAPASPVSMPVRVLVVGAIHGDELSSVSLVLQWIALAGQGPLDAAQQPVHWRFIPALNPDGLFNQPPSRTNAHGVDLNRNFPTPDWERDAKIGWEEGTRKDPRRYPGARPLSEPESQFLQQEIQRFAPQMIVSVHAPYGVLDFDGPPKEALVPPARLGRLQLDHLGIFPGSLGNYGGVHKGIPVVTVELPNSTRTPLDSEIRTMWQDLLRYTQQNAGAMRKPSSVRRTKAPAAAVAPG
jgi:murein peptide amidase A